MTWIEVVDTAVKIGSGAVIGGMFGLLSPFVLIKKEVLLDKRSRRLKHMEETLTFLQDYVTFMSEHAANTSFYWSCHHDNLPELDRAKKDYEKDRDSYDAKHALSVAAMTRLRLLGYNDLANELRAMSDMMHSGLERLEEEMSEQEREAEFYALRGRFSKAGEKFYEEFRKRYDDEPELGRFWRRPFD